LIVLFGPLSDSTRGNEYERSTSEKENKLKRHWNFHTIDSKLQLLMGISKNAITGLYVSKHGIY
jgi:hypothetical protein